MRSTRVIAVAAVVVLLAARRERRRARRAAARATTEVAVASLDGRARAADDGDGRAHLLVELGHLDHRRRARSTSRRAPRT